MAAVFTEDERLLIHEVESGHQDVERCVRIAQQSRNPCFLRVYAEAYNWDDGCDLGHAVADNESCDLGTALALFWLVEAMGVLTGESSEGEYNRSWFKLCEKLIARIPAGFYEPGPGRFDPTFLSRVQIYKLEKRGVNPIFFSAIGGV